MEPDGSMELLWRADLVTPMAIRVAATLRLADHVQRGVGTVAGLAEATGTHHRPLGKLVAHLASIGILRHGPDGMYELGDLGVPLLSEHDVMGIRPTLDIEHMLGRLDMSVLGLLHTVRTGGPGYDQAYGRNMWDDLNENKDLSDGVALLASGKPVFDAELIVDGYRWPEVSHVMDVGGNGGGLVTALLHRHAHLRATLVDLPVFADAARRAIGAAGLSARCDVVGRNFFEALPRGADRCLLSSILCDWDDDDATAILRNCREAVRAGGCVLVSEVHLTGQDYDPVDVSGGALKLEVSMCDPDRSERDIAALAAAAGLELVWQKRARLRSLLEFRPIPDRSTGQTAP